VDRYSFGVGLLHPLLHAGLSRRTYGTVQLSHEIQQRIGQALIEALRLTFSSAERAAHEQRQRIIALEAKRRKLMDAYYLGAVPAELLKEEQDKITKQLADAGAALANVEVNWQTIERNVNMAIALAGRLQAAYDQAKPPVRRQLNQAVIERAMVDVDGVVYARLTSAFDALLSEDFLGMVEAEMKNRRLDSDNGGSSKNVLVVLTCHCANPSPLVAGSPIILTPSNAVLRRGDGDR
jgi:hypothetical protein